jgi:hypothetical protein
VGDACAARGRGVLKANGGNFASLGSRGSLGGGQSHNPSFPQGKPLRQGVSRPPCACHWLVSELSVRIGFQTQPLAARLDGGGFAGCVARAAGWVCRRATHAAGTGEASAVPISTSRSDQGDATRKCAERLLSTRCSINPFQTRAQVPCYPFSISTVLPSEVVLRFQNQSSRDHGRNQHVDGRSRGKGYVETAMTPRGAERVARWRWAPGDGAASPLLPAWVPGGAMAGL